jgi:hypothetical protein
MPEFKRGDWVEVSYDGGKWHKRIYLATIEGAEKPYVCVDWFSMEEFFENNTPFMVLHWEYIRPIRPDLKVDDRVLVRNKSDALWSHRHFAKWGEDGKIEVYANGRTSWTSIDSITNFDKYKLP